MNDIVYLVKECEENEELRYSLRTLTNFPHKKVVIYGGCPNYLKPDVHVYIEQNRSNKWENVSTILRCICNDNNLTKDVWLFNDDFFVMEKIKTPKNYYNGDLYKRIVEIEDKWNRITPYTKLIRKVCKELESLGCETKNYTLHVPLLINRDKLKELFQISDCVGYRSLYANYFNIGGEEMKDVKITSKIKRYKGGIYVSTDDNSFLGAVGQQIREQFPDKCKYEI